MAVLPFCVEPRPSSCGWRRFSLLLGRNLRLPDAQRQLLAHEPARSVHEWQPRCTNCVRSADAFAPALLAVCQPGDGIMARERRSSPISRTGGSNVNIVLASGYLFPQKIGPINYFRG